ncbi:urease accessory protein [Motilibacter rhizosphaerae]|uniref:Urease accessory protein UreF n=1 Tax=Motilibacter rhizosphaerae TaxID=598652 RepID=A0A4Q7NWK3_9ACTN|nr:urease accessory UreF family protein [Motilibacter rhizosphaerae]RZS91693.1 urease accessory protein [Motilibacter rhizosphaerae]
MALAALLVLADGRMPSGGHVHSSGVETAVARGLVDGVPSLQRFLRDRLTSGGLVAASLAAAACSGWSAELLDAEADARTPVPALREASRSQGRALLRAASAAWPSPSYAAAGARPHLPVILGLAAAAGGCTPTEAAAAAAHTSVTGPASAAVRLLGLDPIAVHAVLAALAPEVDEVARTAVHAVEQGFLGRRSSPLLDILGAAHGCAADRGEVTLFAS